MTAILAIIRWAWCTRCWVRTDQDKTPAGWVCRECTEQINGGEEDYDPEAEYPYDWDEPVQAPLDDDGPLTEPRTFKRGI